MECAVVGTWPFSIEAVQVASDLVKLNMDENDRKGCISIDAVEKGINAIEGNVKYGEYFVGCGGVRNKQGYLELDAAIMNGKSLEFGAVTAIQGIQHPISVARRVMEASPHSMLTGSGAQTFAVQHGFQVHEELMEKKDGNPQSTGHDTLGLICSTKNDITVGVSTSGMGGKEAGRVGDSALPGSGLYTDIESGAACCSGDGDVIMKHCPAFRVVHYMKQGDTVHEACDKVIREISRRSQIKFDLVIIAVDTQGNIGAGSTLSVWQDPNTKEEIHGFPYVVWVEGMSEPEIRIQKCLNSLKV
ncbi:N(4)-(Beta-N-acetylglucosaminyl)-L-asparaginase isoform X2 [Patella vulgata]|nr:N(4)-(Beta-N-acetylglucosaminyl)-L-asparaginase isoform X2 [Patella vulgata]XP_050402341.1 N(4)-(Beta-N-acetylglucosaminyl)-L-asparaginase isoform X2 [Patella vulgata]XP_050402343.1 N(4)-(Beta-N-acetylglucosaminyl)-L-asparaginase isoform X2 [Patella vulgata]XP_050402345.1 N(4)-(Beta-N-acetylglucosaminyl)-L-asparaginase isoform X2 [Patella vulgata]XP_050402347.1 N(4)-(Beta-N-acetylglucosaminyl)-L-asparaginase isoform X2 [Patella vulgata]XP_050402349.1 N(4)-(Beta-N-acetylglucosaminyl)-L-aspar